MKNLCCGHFLCSHFELKLCIRIVLVLVGLSNGGVICYSIFCSTSWTLEQSLARKWRKVRPVHWLGRHFFKKYRSYGHSLSKNCCPENFNVWEVSFRFLDCVLIFFRQHAASIYGFVSFVSFVSLHSFVSFVSSKKI